MSRSLLAVSLSIVGLLNTCKGIAAEQRDTHNKRPNVLFVIADQWREEAFGFAGNPDVKTPAFDAFAKQSLWFINAVSTIPVCCPTRATFLTGRRALSHGVFMNDVPLDPKADTIAKRFAASGYETGFIGKWHVDGHGRTGYIPPERRQGFTYWKALECTHEYNNSPYYADGPEKLKWPGYDAAEQTSDAENYIRTHSSNDKPFFLMLSWGPPHEPYQTAPERFRKMYDPVALTLRPNVPAANSADARRDLAGYYAHCTAIDEQFSRLMKTLAELRIDKDTLVIFTSDHGDMLWSQGSQKKQQPWDESCRVPLLFRLPSRFGDAGRVLPSAIGTEDIMPTILNICGIRPPKGVHGLDYTRYMGRGKDPSDGISLVLCPAPFGQWPRSRGGREYRAVRTERYTYARDLKGPWLLFDNVSDPYQLTNLIGRSEAAAIQSQLERLLVRKLKKTDDPFLSGPELIKKWGYVVDSTGTVPPGP